MDKLALAWLCIIAFGFLMYVILDGFTLGIGMLMPFLPLKERNIASSSILPTWDGNQTWVVFSLAALYGMFPLAFAFLLPKIYLPAICLALFLLFRGICFEFRLKSYKGINNWDRLFGFSSLIIAFLHGYLVGQVIQGYSGYHFIEGINFKLLTGLTLCVGYLTLGAARLILKTEGSLRERSYKTCKQSLLFFVLFAILIILYSLYSFHLDKFANNLTLEYKLAPLTFIAFLWITAAALTLWGLFKRNDYLPYWSLVSIFVLTFVSLLIAIFPYIIPYELTYQAAAASRVTLHFTLYIAVIMIPVLLAYTGYAYYVFRGKTTENLEY